ncbi:MAG TPA: hypothetical protein DCM87_16250 [Planctomycetes bacterium]|nr:hypothetical protein [Planctomycetota bacterium]
MRDVLVASFVWAAFAAAGDAGGTAIERIESGEYALRRDTQEYARCALPGIEGAAPAAAVVTGAGDGWTRLRLTWELDKAVARDEVALSFRLPEGIDFWWAPHLAPNDGDCIAQHVFRSPALIAAAGPRVLAIVPDLDICGAGEAAPWFMDIDVPGKRLVLGLGKTKIIGHVHYHRAPGMVLGPGKVELGFYATAYEDRAAPLNPWARVTSFLWTRWGRPLLARGEPSTAPLDAYVAHTYRWAFESWKDAIWQEFVLDGVRVGAPKFIANTTESPNYPGPMDQREFLSIWNQAWFSSLRSATGVARWARRNGDAVLKEKAELTKAFALAAPMRDGLFPSVHRTAMERVEVRGVRVNRSKGWATGYWTNSNRVPRERGVTDAWYHILDASFTALLMLRWHEEIAPDPKLVAYAAAYAAKLLSLQDAKGFFPAWIEPASMRISEVLRESPESAVSATFLLRLAAATGEERYRRAALKAVGALIREIVPEGRWEDFETYWSCCGWGREEFLGRKVPRCGMYKSNTLSMFWTAEALLEAYRATRRDEYLGWGRRVLDELSMYQQVWQPPFIHIPALGGFGVMNFDGEWNDSRQTLFCELFMDYYRETGDPLLFERGVAALRSGFVMMYCPENPKVKPLWEKVWPFFGKEDYGFTMENYGHGGAADRGGGGIGSFTIYDWGNGAAAEARNRVYDHYGDVYIDRARGHAFGIDGVAVELRGGAAALADRAARPRNVKIVFEDGSSTMVKLDGAAAVPLGGATVAPGAGPAGAAGGLDSLWKTPVTGERRRASSWNRTGANRDCFILAPGARVALLGHEGGSGTVRRIWFTLGGGKEEHLETTKLRFRFDGRTTADDVPVGMLAATGPWRVNDVVSPVVSVMRSRPANRDSPGAGQGSVNLLWPMPFERAAAIEVLNDSEARMTMHYHIEYELHPVERPLWFHATYRREHFTTPAGKSEGEKALGAGDYMFADISGHAGRYVGTVLAVESHPSRAGKWYEGDDRFVIDGDGLLHGTGTEDYFGMAWGVHRPYQGYDHGVAHYERRLTENDRFFDGRFVVYRWHLADPISFRRSVRASIEAGHGNECAQHYESVAIWYGRPCEAEQ